MDESANYKQEFIDLRGHLETFLFRFLCNKQDAEDIVQETFLKVSKNINAFQKKSSFKTWVFAIAVNLSKNHLKKQKLWQADYQDKGELHHLKSEELMNRLKDVYASAPDIQFELKEHISYCFNCITKTLSLSQQTCLLLKEVYQFKTKEIMKIAELTEGQVKHNLSYARKIMIRVFDNRCAIINKNGICNQCTALMGILNPKQNAQERASQLKLARQQEAADKNHLLDLRIELVKSVNPLNSSNSHLHTYMLEQLPEWAAAEN